MLTARPNFAAAGCCLLVFLGTVGTCTARSTPAHPGSGDASAAAYFAQAERAPAPNHIVTLWPSQPILKPRMVLGAELRCIAGLALLELGFLSLLFLGGRQCGNKASRRKLESEFGIFPPRFSLMNSSKGKNLAPWENENQCASTCRLRVSSLSFPRRSRLMP
jgi:hypothetical protein